MNSIPVTESNKGEPIDHEGTSQSSDGSKRLRDAIRWLSEQLAFPAAQASTRLRLARLLAVCAAIFLLALGVRLLHWQDHRVEIPGQHTLLTRLGADYRRDVQQMLDGGGILIPANREDAANILPHPPGYSMLLRAMFGSDLDRESYSSLHVLQIICDAIAAALVVIITSQLLPMGIATIAGMLVAFSPHLSNYSLWLTPESLAVLPILIAVYLIIEAMKRPRLILAIAAGAMVGLSCWLRANGLLLAPFLALVILLVFERGKRLRFSMALVAAMIVVISPIGLRNWIVFHKFIPLSLGAGITLVQGIADYDTERRFGMPADDRETSIKDAEWFGRPDYTQGIWSPDGIERDRYRFRRGLEVIRSNPFWFAGVMLRRASFMLKYNKPDKTAWPFDTVLVPQVSSEPPFGHDTAIVPQTEPQWRASPSELIGEGATLSRQAEIRVATDNSSLQLTGDSSPFGDQLASAPIAVEKNTDYVLTLSVNLINGPLAAKVTSADRRFSLASLVVRESEDKKTKKAKRKASLRDEPLQPADSAIEQQMWEIKLAFSSGNRSEVLLVISNNGESPVRPIVLIGEAKLYNLGPTPQLWTRMVRPAVRKIQTNLYTTSHMLSLVMAGLVLLGITRRRDALLVLLAVPAYYLCVQSAFHTEYRYILAIHYLLFIMAAITVYIAYKLMGLGVGRVAATHRRSPAN